MPSSEKPRYIEFPNGKRYALLSALDQVPHAELPATERLRFMHAVEILDFGETERRKIRRRERHLQIAQRSVELSQSAEEIQRNAARLDTVEDEVLAWEATAHPLELSVTTLETLISFAEKAPMFGGGVRLLQPIVEEMKKALAAEEGSEYLKPPKNGAELLRAAPGQ